MIRALGLLGKSRAEIYRWSEALLWHHQYWTLKRCRKGLIRAYMERMTGLIRAQCAARRKLCEERAHRGGPQPLPAVHAALYGRGLGGAGAGRPGARAAPPRGRTQVGSLNIELNINLVHP